MLCLCDQINVIWGSGGILQLGGQDKGRSLALHLINQFVNSGSGGIFQHEREDKESSLAVF